MYMIMYIVHIYDDCLIRYRSVQCTNAYLRDSCKQCLGSLDPDPFGEQDFEVPDQHSLYANPKHWF